MTIDDLDYKTYGDVSIKIPETMLDTKHANEKKINGFAELLTSETKYEGLNIRKYKKQERLKGNVNISFLISTETRDYISQEAESEYRNISDQLRLILDSYVKSKLKGNQNAK